MPVYTGIKHCGYYSYTHKLKRMHGICDPNHNHSSADRNLKMASNPWRSLNKTKFCISSIYMVIFIWEISVHIPPMQNWLVFIC